MKHAILTIFISAIFLFVCLTSFSCKSVPAEIPAGRSAQELIQNGQTAYEKGKNEEALRYFNTVVDRYGSDTAIYIEARYEIAHLYMKEKKYEQAIPILEEIRDIYPNTEPGVLPGAYEKLAEIELAKIPDELIKKFDAQKSAKPISNN